MRDASICILLGVHRREELSATDLPPLGTSYCIRDLDEVAEVDFPWMKFVHEQKRRSMSYEIGKFPPFYKYECCIL